MVSLPVHGTATVHPASLMKARFGSGRLIFPVKPSQAIYARFEHVAGLPSSRGEGGLSLSKLMSIDKLIDRLIHLKKMAGTGEQRAEIERLIQELEYNKSDRSADLGQAVREHADELSSLVRTETVYPPQGGFEALLFNISA